ncbi:cerebellar degeneration-related protein 2 isoform X2 [Syngnathoides biaculeatus]|uniref:cerebellar degeneration-related protein 2 isoform X2 n=1 Tax=Syngnathoides biaculeatus TaxID=300417 RepID=UPI002ADDD44E|nr:cerebellar degeneration-related protein 2 isoform X2 [Syngnathoides biaculeatus]
MCRDCNSQHARQGGGRARHGEADNSEPSDPRAVLVVWGQAPPPPLVTMLTEGILEDDLDKIGTSCCAQRDLEHDLHLAAELGKTLLDRNRELEQALQQMYNSNQEQLLEIEYLAKQVELLRHMNDQHAKVYEQLDLSTRDLDRGNKRLVQDQRLAQNKINSLTESIDGLQTHVEDLEKQLEVLVSSRSERNKQEQRRNLAAQSVSCLKELYDLHHDGRQTEGLRSVRYRDRRQNPEDEHETLLRSVDALRGQLAAEKTRREAAERDGELAAEDGRGLERRLHLLAGCRARRAELEVQVEQLRLLWRAECASRKPAQLLLPDTVFFTSENQPQEGNGESEDDRGSHRRRRRRNSDGYVNASDHHDRMCARRAAVVKARGISLLNEVDAQYRALQVKYDELLQRCQRPTGGLTHKSVQTSRGAQAAESASAPSHEPEYKVLFKEIFTCIQKTKDDVHERRLVRDASAV